MDIKNDKIRTNESTTIATFVLHPNVIQAIKDKSPDDEHFDNVRHFYFGENQFVYVIICIQSCSVPGTTLSQYDNFMRE
ncbi:1288_t:CDS:2 [Entrophospora sp. SA101]|nr:1288_t:CDS:2 [Entrophospora sp. SA101]